MNISKLIKRNIKYYIGFYKLIAAAVMIAVAVIIGSLMVGESVRSTLVKRVGERLGDTETILFSKNSFFESSIIENSLFEGKGRAVLLVNGFIPDAGRLVPVMVWGVDDMDIPVGSAKVNTALASELSVSLVSTESKASPESSDLQDIYAVLRLPATGMVPSGSLFVTGNYTTSARLKLSGIVSTEAGGNLNLKNEQVIPYNIFVNRSELASILQIEGKINLLLHCNHLSAEDLNNIWTPQLSGISVNAGDGFAEVVSDRVFIQKEAVETICKDNPEANRHFSYMANSIETHGESIPYSFVTAVDRYRGRILQKDEVILSDYSAQRLNARIGDVVRVTYYTSSDLKTLSVDTVYGSVAAIVPLAELFADKTLSAEFPGLTDVESCTDWDSDLPINMDLITKEDEDYWEEYRSTPKIIVSYDAVSEDWSNTYGSATAIRILKSPTPALPQGEGEIHHSPLSTLHFSMFGLQIIHPRELGLNAAVGGVDFASLFLSLGFFIILSAILLMLVPLSEMIHRRKNDIALWFSLGYSAKRILRILWMESAPVVLISSTFGVIAGIIYARVVLVLLGSLWRGATQTGGFFINFDIGLIFAGFFIGVAMSMSLLFITIVRTISNLNSKNNLRKEQIMWYNPLRSKLYFALFFSALVLGIIPFNLAMLQSALLFVFTGILLIVTALLWGDYIISRKGKGGSNLQSESDTTYFDESKLVWANLYANRKRALLSFFTLAVGIFIVFSVGLNRKSFSDSAQLLTGTGGYSLWCESSVPIYHNIATAFGREKLALTDLPSNTSVLQINRYGADDASCLNLNKVSQPTVLGVDMDAFENSNFEILQSIYPESVSVYEMMKAANASVSASDMTKAATASASVGMNETKACVYPALVDETVLLWGLMLNLGDTLIYEDESGQEVYLQIAGTIKNSVFQGNILIDKTVFSSIWSEITGSEVLLLKVDEQDVESAKKLLSQALNEYGVKVTTTAQRLSEFNRVTDTYLDIFLTLGGIGLLLGIMSFTIVIRKDLVSRKEQIKVYRSLGFHENRIESLLIRENMLVPLYAIAVGALGSLLGIGSGFANVGFWIWLITIIQTVLFVTCVMIFIKKSVRKAVGEGGEK